jgi:hypothetical protein
MPKLDEIDSRIQDLLTQIKKIDLSPVFGRDFENKDIYLDGREFVDCSFENCRLYSNIGHWQVSGKYQLQDCVFEFGYPARVVWDTTLKTKPLQNSN